MVNVVALKVLWSVAAATHVFALMVLSVTVWKLVSHYYEKQNSGSKPGGRSGIDSKNKVNNNENDVHATGKLMDQQQQQIPVRRTAGAVRMYTLKLGTLLCGILSSTILLIVSIWKAYDKNRNVGSDVAIGVLYFVGNTLWFASIGCLTVFFLQLQIINAQTKHKDWRDRLRMFTYRILPGLIFMSVSSIVAGAAMYVDSYSLLVSQICIAVAFGLMAVSIVALSWVFLFLILYPLRRDLLDAIEGNTGQPDSTMQKRSEGMKKLVTKINLVVYITFVGCSVSAPVVCVCAFVPELMLRIAYLVPCISMSAASFQGTRLLFFVIFCGYI